MDPNLPQQQAVPQQPQAVPQPSAAPRPIDPYNMEGKRGGSIIKKLLIIFIVIIVLALVIGGAFLLFGRISTSGKPKNVTLTYWGAWEDVAIMQPIIADFERNHPNIKIQYEKIDIKGLKENVVRYKTRIDNGKGPDIFRFHSSWTFQLRNYLLPFPESVVKATEIETDYYKTVQKDMQLAGAYYGLPLGVDTLSMFVNQQLLQDKGLPIPTDWNDIYSRYASELVVKDQSGKIVTPGISLGTFDNIAHASDIVAFILLQNGANIEDLTNEKTKKNAVDAFLFYTNFADNDKATWDETLDNSTLAFAKGNLAIYFGYSWDIFAIKGLNPQLQFQVVKVPSLAGRKNTVSSYWAEGVSSKSKNPKEAFEFITYLSKPETLQKLYQTQTKIRPFGTLYPRKSMAPLLSSNEMLYPFVSQADDAQSTFFSSDTYDGESGMITQMNVYLGNAIRSMNNNTSAETAVNTLAQGAAEVIAKH